MGQREEIERLVEQALNALRGDRWLEFDRTISELRLYELGMIEDVVSGRMRFAPPNLEAMELAHIHEAVTISEEREIKKTHAAARYHRKTGKLPAGWKFIPEVKYPIPILPEVEDKPERRELLAAYIDDEGTIGEAWRGYNTVNRGVYKREYGSPRVKYWTTTRALNEKVAKLLGIHYPEASGSRAISALHYIYPYLLVPEKRLRTVALFAKYREAPWIRIK